MQDKKEKETTDISNETDIDLYYKCAAGHVFFKWSHSLMDLLSIPLHQNCFMPISGKRQGIVDVKVSAKPSAEKHNVQHWEQVKLFSSFLKTHRFTEN